MQNRLQVSTVLSQFFETGYLELSQLQETLSSQTRDLEKANKVSRRPYHHLIVTLYCMQALQRSKKAKVIVVFGGCSPNKSYTRRNFPHYWRRMKIYRKK